MEGKVIFKNDINISILDKEFYLVILKNILGLKN